MQAPPDQVKHFLYKSALVQTRNPRSFPQRNFRRKELDLIEQSLHTRGGLITLLATRIHSGVGFKASNEDAIFHKQQTEGNGQQGEDTTAVF